MWSFWIRHWVGLPRWSLLHGFAPGSNLKATSYRTVRERKGLGGAKIASSRIPMKYRRIRWKTLVFLLFLKLPDRIFVLKWYLPRRLQVRLSHMCPKLFSCLRILLHHVGFFNVRQVSGLVWFSQFTRQKHIVQFELSILLKADHLYIEQTALLELFTNHGLTFQSHFFGI